MSKRIKHSPTPFVAKDGRRVFMSAELHDEPKWDVFIAALLAYALAQVKDDENGGES